MNILKRLIPDKVKVKLKSMFSGKPPQIDHLEPISYCICCGSRSIIYSPILWDALIQEWGLSEFETNYINRQQGIRCKRCKANLRTMAIAYGMMRNENYRGLFQEFVRTRKMSKKHILEVNETGQMTQYLQQIRYHTLGEYPDVDIQKLPYNDATFDVVIHSDTLEHVPDPIAALKECGRVLKPDGYCIFTVPLIIDRISKTRAGLPLSYHGSQDQEGDDYIVQTEFGSDVWKYVLQAGFAEVRIYSLEYPAAQSLLCKK
jgi:SAM-dependent methyltransferase